MPTVEVRRTSKPELLQHGKKWKELSGVLCDRRMPTGVKGKVYRTMVRPVLIYGSEAWTLRRREEERLERTEMRMLRRTAARTRHSGVRICEDGQRDLLVQRINTEPTRGSALGLLPMVIKARYALSTAGTPAATGQESSTC